jgi:GTP diphosphokinase / guanosine-3',5'-bis(diphosphate) 3'-diphosphatase
MNYRFTKQPTVVEHATGNRTMANDLTRLLHAATFAGEKHRDQRRKDIQCAPYINHPLAVADVLARVGQLEDIELLIAAILHDTVEDTDTSFEELNTEFGTVISDLVAEVTDDKTLLKEQRKQMQIDKAPFKSDRAKQLKIADKICNVRDMSDDSPANWDRARKMQYFDWAVNVVAGCRGINSALEDLFDAEIQNARDRLSDSD